MKRFCITIILLVLSVNSRATDGMNLIINESIPIVSDTLNYANMYISEVELNHRLKDSLDVITKRLNILKSETGKNNSKLDNRLKKKIQEINSKEKALKKAYEKKENDGICKLESDYNLLQLKIDSLIADTTRIRNRIESIGLVMDSLNKQKGELLLLQEELRAEVIDGNAHLLHGPLSLLPVYNLKILKQECNRFNIDSCMVEFIGKIDTVLMYKDLYDKAYGVICSKYDSQAILDAIDDLSSITRLKDGQSEEVSKLIETLKVYEMGIFTFQQYIKEFNKKRDGMTNYTVRDYNDDIPYIIEKLSDHIKNNILIIPYLEKLYSKYVEIIETNPMSHPEIEREIMDYKITVEKF